MKHTHTVGYQGETDTPAMLRERNQHTGSNIVGFHYVIHVELITYNKFFSDGIQFCDSK